MMSFRITGCYVCFSIIQRPYKGWSLPIIVWLVLLVWVNVLMAPTPIAIYIHNLVPHLPVGLQLFTQTVTIQRILPYFFAVHIFMTNIGLLRRNYYLLKKMK